MGMQITKKDVAAARRVYWWLFLMPLLAVPCWFYNYPSSANFSTRSDALLASISAAAIPLIFYLPVFMWAFITANPYLNAHARQALILLALRFVSASLFGYFQTSVVSENGETSPLILVFLLCNAFLWFVGSIVGLVQAGHGNAWLGNIHAEITKDLPPQQAIQSLPATESHPNEETVAFFLIVFHYGDRSERQAAVAKLETLGEVETF